MATAKFLGDEHGKHVRMTTCPNCEQRVPRKLLGDSGMCADCEREEAAALSEMENANPGADLDLCEYNTADNWPDWTGIETCRCDLPLDDMLVGGSHDTVPEHCPNCGLEMLALVYPHCAHCHRMIVGWYFVDDAGDDYCSRECAAAGWTEEPATAERGPDLYVLAVE